jgi:osmotically-inducible protein OsmY
MRTIGLSTCGLAIILTIGCSKREMTGAADRTRDEAERAAESASRAISDAAITTGIKAKLAADVKLSTLTKVSVDTKNGVVTLTGEVPTADYKREVEESTRTIDGVKRIVNDLKIEPDRPTR